MKQVNFITIGGTKFALPDDMTTKQKADFAGVCLQLQPLGSCYGHGWKDFYYVQDSASVQLGMTPVYSTRESAEVAAAQHKADNAEPTKLESVA